MSDFESSSRDDKDPLADWMRKERRRLRSEIWQWLDGQSSTAVASKNPIRQPGVDSEHGFSPILLLDVSVSTGLSQQLELEDSEGNDLQG